jgi:Hypervirulence associated proteins TUDOR domain
MTGKTFKAGDKVRWDHSQGTTTGKVVKKLTSPTKIKGHKVAASKEHPEYLVEGGKTGARAAHTPEELRKA